MLWSQLMKRFEDHDIRLTSNEFICGLPAKPFDKYKFVKIFDFVQRS